MSEQKRSERVVIEITDNEWVGRRRRIAETWAHEIAALEAKLEATTRVRDELWCRSITVLEDLHDVQRILMRFDQLRPDPQPESDDWSKREYEEVEEQEDE